MGILVSTKLLALDYHPQNVHTCTINFLSLSFSKAFPVLIINFHNKDAFFDGQLLHIDQEQTAKFLQIITATQFNNN